MCTGEIPVRYKHNAIIGKLHWDKQTASDFNKELKRIRQVSKYWILGEIYEQNNL